ncbi:MAG: DUF2442 domain-containing protein [Candidatus Electronema sp. VV]
MSDSKNITHAGKHGFFKIYRSQLGLKISITDDEITAFLNDGRSISVLLAWSWRLSEATPAQRQHYKIIGDGQGIHWPDIDEDIKC